MAGLGCSDSLASSQSEEPALVELTSKLTMPTELRGGLQAAIIDHQDCERAYKKRRLQQEHCLAASQQEYACRGVQACAPASLSRATCDASRASAEASDATALGPLDCSEAPECLEDAADCSSEATEEGFVVFQSPLSLATAGQREAAVAGVFGGAGAGVPAVLTEQLPPRLASDPDLAEMISVLYESEAELQPAPGYLEARHGPAACPDLFLDATMRRTATSWLVEVATEFGLHQETLFLGVALLDRFLATAQGVPRTQLQLLAVACMLIASKHEEEMHPSVLDFASIADNCFTPGDLLRMEAIVLDCLSFRVNTPTAHTFLSMLKQALGLQPRTCALASYLAELALLEYDPVLHPPSRVASAATLMAQLYLGDTLSIGHLPSVARRSLEELKPCMRRLLSLQRAAFAARDFSSPYLPVRDKYRGPQWLCVACTTPLASAAAMASALHAACGSSVGGGNAGGDSGDGGHAPPK